MAESKLCKGCGQRMTVEDPRTKTHPLQECYRQRIENLESLLKTTIKLWNVQLEDKQKM